MKIPAPAIINLGHNDTFQPAYTAQMSDHLLIILILCYSKYQINISL